MGRPERGGEAVSVRRGGGWGEKERQREKEREARAGWGVERGSWWHETQEIVGDSDGLFRTRKILS